MAGISELPDRIHPMIVKELHQSMRRASFVYPFLLMQLLAIAAMCIEFAKGEPKRADFVGVMNLVMLFDCGPFWSVVGGMCGLIMPLAGLMLMGQEVEDGNHELLLLTKLSRWSIVRGKFSVLWAVSALSFLSLLPYVVVRYFMGGVEFLQEMACSLTVLSLAALVSAGAIGASSFKNIAARFSIFALYLFTALISGATALAACAWSSRRWSSSLSTLVYHTNVFFYLVCYVMLGLALARTRLRLVLHFYEPHPRVGMIALLIVTPIVCGISALITAGYAGALGLLGMTFAAFSADNTPRGKPLIVKEY